MPEAKHGALPVWVLLSVMHLILIMWLMKWAISMEATIHSILLPGHAMVTVNLQRLMNQEAQALLWVMLVYAALMICSLTAMIIFTRKILMKLPITRKWAQGIPALCLLQ